jgi:hypothetical protein
VENSVPELGCDSGRVHVLRERKGTLKTAVKPLYPVELQTLVLLPRLSLARNLERPIFDSNLQVLLFHSGNLSLHQIFTVLLNNINQR